MAYKVLGLVDCFGNPEMGPLNRHRAIASTSLLGRYAFIDVQLSNFLHSGISSMGVLCQNHIRSLSRHLGNGMSWISNTKLGDFTILYDEPNIQNSGYNTDVNDLIENDWYLKEINPDYVVITNPYIVFSADYGALLEDHIASGAKITLLYAHKNDLSSSFMGQDKVYLTDRGKVTRIESNHGDIEEGDVSLGTMIMDIQTLHSLIDFAKDTSSFFGLWDVLRYISPSILVRCVKHEGYVRCFDSLSHYLEYSMELLDENVSNTFFNPERPIVTKSYDTPPTLLRKNSKVVNSSIANGSIIEGEVYNSIIGRGVVIKEGCVIRNSVISSGSYIGPDTGIEFAVVDKEARVEHVSNIKGTLEDPLYIMRGDIV